MDPQAYPEAGIREVEVVSSVDGSQEPSLLCPAGGDAPRPLLVGLHTWSADRHNQVDNLLPLARKHHWHLLLPEFRGPNLAENPRCSQACASRAARQDIVDAVERACADLPVDRDAILLAGGSGGGHMAMMMAAYRPDLWRVAASFCGISDLSAWHGENSSYARHMEACCGGPPSGDAAAQYRERSPIAHAQRLAQARLCIFHGKFDRAVPFTHAVKVFDAVNAAAPASKVFLRIFDGAHDMPKPMLEETLLGALSPAKENGTITR
jgi:predicted esterase